MPASGPGWSGTLSGTTGKPVPAKRSARVIGIEDEAGTLRAKSLDHAFENGAAADADACLIGAAHAAGKPAGEHDAERMGKGHAPFAG